METIDYLLQELYRNFNNHKIDLVIAQMTNDMKWANGMDGDYVYGHDEVKEYWTGQFQLVSAQVNPIEIDTEDQPVKIKVHQVVHDLNGNLMADRSCGTIFI